MNLALFEASSLFFTADGEPELNQINTASCKKTLKFRAFSHELEVLFIGAEAHNAFYAGAVIPGTVKKDDFAGGRQMRNVSLEVPLTKFSLSRFFQSDHACAAGIQVLHEAADCAAFACSIASFKEDYNALSGFLNPSLQLEKFDLKKILFFFVELAAHAVFVRIAAVFPVFVQFVLANDRFRLGRGVFNFLTLHQSLENRFAVGRSFSVENRDQSRHFMLIGGGRHLFGDVSFGFGL